jgi:hypothetical protein
MMVLNFRVPIHLLSSLTSLFLGIRQPTFKHFRSADGGTLDKAEICMGHDLATHPKIGE